LGFGAEYGKHSTPNPKQKPFSGAAGVARAAERRLLKKKTGNTLKLFEGFCLEEKARFWV
jgi:hypothetical protein